MPYITKEIQSKNFSVSLKCFRNEITYKVINNHFVNYRINTFIHVKAEYTDFFLCKKFNINVHFY